jgi:hypothetical protein
LDGFRNEKRLMPELIHMLEFNFINLFIAFEFALYLEKVRFVSFKLWYDFFNVFVLSVFNLLLFRVISDLNTTQQGIMLFFPFPPENRTSDILENIANLIFNLF